MINWEHYREQFPVTKHHTYFMTAGAGSIPDTVLEAIINRYTALSLHGGDAYEENIKTVERCREKIAKLINADSEDIAFIPNVSFGMNALASSIEPNVPFLIPEEEFPSSIVPWRNTNFDVNAVSHLHDLDTNLIHELSSKKGNTSLITSFVQYSRGYRSDLELLSSILPSKDSLFIVNATQGIGVFPIDVKKAKIDALVCACHKWLFCGEGIAFMYVNRELIKKMKPGIVGWRSSPFAMQFNHEFQFYENARVFEIGWANMTIFAGFEKALDLVFEIGVEHIADRVHSLMHYLLDGLKRINVPLFSNHKDSNGSGIALLGPFINLDYVFDELYKKNILTTKRGNGIRIALHFYNNEEDIDLLLTALNNLKK